MESERLLAELEGYRRNLRNRARAENSAKSYAADWRPILVAGGTTQHLAATYRGLATELRRAATGLVLQPRHASEGDLLGVALPRLHAPPPGRGVLVDRGRTLVVQVALPRAPADQGTIVG